MPLFPTAQLEEARISATEDIIDYVCRDKELLRKALAAAGATTDSQGNKPLALIGDGCMKVAFYERGYENEAATGSNPIDYALRIQVYPFANSLKGDTSQTQSSCTRNENLIAIGRSLGLDSHIQLNPSAQGVVQPKLIATTMEAIVGAVYLDSNRDMGVVRRVVLHLGIMPAL